MVDDTISVEDMEAAGEAAIGGGDDSLETTRECEVNAKKIPIIFLPGVMGSRLKLTKSDTRWDPDNPSAMFHWVRLDADLMRQKLHHTSPAEVITPDKDYYTKEERSQGYQKKLGGLVVERIPALTSDEMDRGYTGVALKYYLNFLRCLSVHSFKLGVLTPVHAVGYDWRQDNRTSAATLKLKVAHILQREGASQCILVTHSMGGIVARAAMMDHLFENSVLGIVHVFQPVDGAVVLYRRFFTGALQGIDAPNFSPETLFIFIVGTTPEKAAVIASGMPGPLQLLPTNNYRDTGGAGWLDYKVNGAVGQWTGDVYGLYTGKAFPPAVLEFSAPPPGVKKVAAEDLKKNILDAGKFHKWLGRYRHPRTEAIYGTALDTDMGVRFDPPTAEAAKPKIEKNFWLGPKIVPPDIRRHRKQGDGVVPSTSAGVLTPTSSVEKVEHAAACDNPVVQKLVKNLVEKLLT